MQHYNHSQFKTLVQHELARLETIINQNNTPGIYSTYRYTQTPRSRILLSRRQPSIYHGLFSFIQKVRFMMF